MRAERLLSIILLLQAHHRMTASDLAERLNVSERTILRDMDALSTASVPVYSERGRNGGWQLLDGYRSSLTGLNDTEIQALLLTPTRILSDLGLEDAAGTAMLKLLASLPQVRRSDIELVQERIHVDGAPWSGSSETVTYLPQLQSAIWQNEAIKVRYQRGDSDSVERILFPLGLVAKGRIWYLIALIDEDYRTYRVSRIQNLETTGAIFERPVDFNLAGFWEQSTREFVATLPHYVIRLDVKKEAMRFIREWRFARIESITEKDDIWLTVTVDTEDLAGAVACVLSCGGDAIVIEPDELAKQVQLKIQQMKQDTA